MQRTWVPALLIGVFLAGTTISPRAETIDRLYAFTAFTGGPISPETGTFSIVFDNSADVFNSTLGLTLITHNILLHSAFAYSYSQASDTLVVGGLSLGVEDGSFADNFVLDVHDATLQCAPI